MPNQQLLDPDDGEPRSPTDIRPATAGAGASDSDIAALLAAATSRPASPDTMTLLAGLNPSATPALSLLHAIVACQNLISWADAVQQSLLAEIARPGVAVPLEQVVDAARWSAAKPGEVAAADQVLDQSTDPVSDGRCAAAIAGHAARFASMEVGAALHLSPLTARDRVERALHLVDVMPTTLAAQRAGHLDPLRTRILLDTTIALPRELGAAVETAALTRAATSTPSQLRSHIARTVISLDPTGAADRARRAKRSRDVYSNPQPDEMATVTALLQADKAANMMWLLNTMADATAGHDDDHRDAGQRRADALTDMIDTLISTGAIDLRHPTRPPTDEPHTATQGSSERSRQRPRAPGRPPVCLNVYVSASTLAGLDNLPAELAGHGVITADLARTIAASATAARAILVGRAHSKHPAGDFPTCDHDACTDGPHCGTTLDFGRQAYRPAAALDDHVRARDRTCRFPGCRRSAHQCDLDHAIAYDDGGPTCACNLRALCRAHHLAKTFTGWSSVTTADGTVIWTSPLGLRYPDPPDHPVAQPLPATDDPPPF